MFKVTLIRSLLVLLPCFAGLFISLINFFENPWKDDIGLNLGLDLQGGVHLLLEVDTSDVVKEYSQRVAKDLRRHIGRKRDKSGGIIYAGVDARNEKIFVRLSKATTFSKKSFDQLSSYTKEFVRNEGSVLLGGQSNLIIADEQKANSDGKTIVISVSEKKRDELVSEAVKKSLEIVRRRIDSTGVTEPNVQRQGKNRILLQLPGFSDSSRVRNLLGQVAKLNLHMVDEDASSGKLSLGGKTIFLPMIDGRAGDSGMSDFENEIGGNGNKVPVFKEAEIVGEQIKDAKVSYDQGGSPVVLFVLNSSGAANFARISRENIGKRMAIVLDNKIVSAPVIRVPILDGRASIEGGFSVQEATDLAITLRSGALPAPMRFLEERTVGPDLGADSIESGKIASIVALAIVALFIVIYYGVFGAIAFMALVFNIGLIFGTLSLLQATLTLPGLAGIVLTIGMAVDANVLIFERIREELRLGRTPMNAVETGYKQALATIWDSNITTGIVAFILMGMASGPVQGFAVTLGIGILSSVYCATLVTKLLISIFWKIFKPKNVERLIGM